MKHIDQDKFYNVKEVSIITDWPQYKIKAAIHYNMLNRTIIEKKVFIKDEDLINYLVEKLKRVNKLTDRILKNIEV